PRSTALFPYTTLFRSVRGQIMPINRRYNVETLLSACDYYAARKKQRLTFEYILIEGVNDSDEQARLLGRRAKRLSAKVNLIPYRSEEHTSELQSRGHL